MMIRERKTVVQLYRAVYDRQTLRSRTETLGSFPNDGEPPGELLGRLTAAERQALSAYLSGQAAEREAKEVPALVAEVPHAMRRIAAWMRVQPKTSELKQVAKTLRDAYGELYGVMRTLGMARLREGKKSLGAATEEAKPARPRRRRAAPLVLGTEAARATEGQDGAPAAKTNA